MLNRMLDNRWISRAGNASFLIGVVIVGVRYASGLSPLSIATVVLVALGVLLMLIPHRTRLSRIAHRSELVSESDQAASSGRAIAEYEATKRAEGEARTQALFRRLQAPSEPATYQDVYEQEVPVRASKAALSITASAVANARKQAVEKPQLMSAARLLRTELRDIRHKIRMLHGDPVLADGFAFPASQWNRYSELIAGYPELYDVLEAAYTAAHHANEIWRWRRTQATSRLIGANLEQDGIDLADQKAESAIRVLDSVIGKQ